MNRGYDRDFDYLDLEDDSDQEISDSSEDELDIILHGTPEQKRKLQRNLSGKDSSSEDEFEKEMNKELNARVEALESSLISKSQSSGTNTGSSSSSNVLVSSVSKCSSKSSEKSKNKDKGNDEVYFDSDEEEMIRAGEERVKRKNSEVSNDDLFYDPTMDDEDQKWVDKLQRNHQPKSSNSIKPVAKSDAVLNCPACMTTLCLDCQRHSLYKNQYRAMFVMNCNVDTTEVLKQPTVKSKNNKKQKKKKSKQNNSDSNSSTGDNQTMNDDSESVHPVKCTECNTVVAVYDKDEIFHFFNVLASHG